MRAMTVFLLPLLLTGCAGDGGSPETVPSVQQQATPPAPSPQPPASPTPAPSQPATPPTPEIIPPPPAPEKLALAFTGEFGTDGTVSGTFTYIKDQGPIETNVRHLKDNVVYQLDDWDLTVNSASMEDLLPSTRYRKEDQGSSAEFCLGYCVFASAPLISLTFRNATNLILLLTFEMQDPTPMINPPSSVSEWGPLILNGSMYRVPCPICTPVALFKNGLVQEQTKTPGVGF
jgi:hypothetical protein